MFYLPIFNKWCWIEDTSVNFALKAIKPNISVTPPGVTLDTQTNETNTIDYSTFNIGKETE